MGGFYHGSVNSDSYVVLAGGGYKSVSDFLLSQDHYKTSPGAGTAGTSDNTSGSTLAVPYVTVNANGHVTGYGTHTHTITGFATEHTHPYLPLAGGTMTGNIGMGSDSTKFLISSGSSGANSPLRGTKMPATSSNWIGLFARPSKSTDEGGILLSEDTCVVYNSHDTGWGFLVVDTDLSQSDWSVDSARAFGVNDSHQAWSLGGFVKSGSSDSYVLLGGGGHKAVSDFLTSHQSFSVFENYHNTANSGTNANTHALKITIGSTTRYCTPQFLGEYSTVDYGIRGLLYMNLYGPDTGRGSASTNGTPTDDWYHVIRMNHDNNGGYFVDIATCFHSWNMWYRQIKNGFLEDSTVDSGWARILDNKNSSVSLSGSTLTVKIAGVEKSLTNTWRTVQCKGTSIGSNTLNLKEGTNISLSNSSGAITISATDNNTWRKVQLDGTDKLGTGTGTNPLNIKAGTGMSITESSGTFTFTCTVTAGDVYWKDVKDKIRHDNEFNIVPSGYNSTMWFNYRSDANTNVTVSEYILGNGSAGYAALTCANITCLAIDSYGITPRSNDSYSLGTSSYRWTWGYYTTGLVIGPTDYTGPHTSYEGTWIQRGWIEMSAESPYIDLHMKNTYGYFATVNSNDYKARLILWLDKARLLTEYDVSSHYTGGYIANTEGSLGNIVCLGVISIYRADATSGTWYCIHKHGLVDAEVLYLPYDYYYTQSSGPAYLQRGLIIKVIPYYTTTNEYSSRNTKVNVAFAIGSVQSRWWGEDNANHRAVHGRTEGSERNTAYGSFQIGVVGTDSVTPGTTNPGKNGPDTGNILVITAYRPNGNNDNDYIGEVQFDGLLETGNGAIASFRVAIFGYMT